jgi:hypothetical protein
VAFAARRRNRLPDRAAGSKALCICGLGRTSCWPPLVLLGEGASNKTTARRRAISVHTAKFRVASVIDKLDVIGRTDAGPHAARLGIIKSLSGMPHQLRPKRIWLLRREALRRKP